jgi:hypothetical protein
MEDLAKFLVLFGGIMVVIGGALLLAGRIPFIGRLPGDITMSHSVCAHAWQSSQ